MELNPITVQKRLDDAHAAGKVKSAKQFADFSIDLQESEIQEALKIIVNVQQRYSGLRNSVENLEKLRDEVLTRLSDIGILASFDPTPCYYGEPPEVEFIGKISTDPIHKDGFDHERKRHDILKANERGEDFLGQKERVKRVPRDKPESG